MGWRSAPRRGGDAVSPSDGVEVSDVLTSGDDREPSRWPARLVVVALLAGLVWLALGPDESAQVSDTGRRDASSGAAEHPVVVPGDVLPLPPGTAVTVPRAHGFVATTGIGILQGAGLRVAVRQVFRACWPAGWVVDQRPRPGRTVDAGTRVVLTVTDEQSARMVCPEGVATGSDWAVVERFLAFARNPGPRSSVRWADPVTILADGVHVRVRADRADRRRTWIRAAGSDSGATYLLEKAAAVGGSFLVQAAETRRCPGPREFAELRRIAISDTDPTGAPDRRADDCRPGSAVSLYVDPLGLVAGVQVVGDPGR